MAPRSRGTKKTGAPFYAVVGSDESQVKARAQALAEELRPAEAGDFGLDTIDGSADNADQAVKSMAEVQQAVQTLPFFGHKKVVWLKNANFLGDSVMARASSVQTALEGLREFLERGLPPGTTLLLSATEIDKRRAFYKALGRLAQLQVLDRIDPSRPGWEEDAEAVVRGMAAEIGLRFEPDALVLFIQRTGADTRQIATELAKLELYLGAERSVTESTVRDLVAHSASSVIWELSNAVARRDLAGSLQLLDQLLGQGESAIGILLAAIIPTMRNLFAVKDLLEKHSLQAPAFAPQFGTMLNSLPQAATVHLPRKKDGGLNVYGLSLAARETRRFKLNELRAGLDHCLSANVQLVSTQLDPRLVLTELLVKLLGSEKESGRKAR
jgi:DNA polymerase-3 subunit delta